MYAAIMIIWTVVSVNADGGATPVAVSQTTTEVSMVVCERAQKISGSDVKLPKKNGPVLSVAVTVRCIPKG